MLRIQNSLVNILKSLNIEKVSNVFISTLKSKQEYRKIERLKNNTTVCMCSY